MVTINESAMVARQEQIMRLLHDDALTVNEISEVTRWNYFTTRKDVLALADQGKIAAVGTRNRATVWSGNSENLRGWPVIATNREQTKGASLKNMAVKVRSEFYVTPALKAVLLAEHKFLRILLHANDVRNNEFHKTALEADRMELHEAIKELEITLCALRSLATTEKIWHEDGLRMLSQIDDFPSSATLKQIEEQELPIVLGNFVNYATDTKEAILNAAQPSAVGSDGQDAPAGEAP